MFPIPFKQKSFLLFLLICICLSSCSSFHYYSRVVFWNFPGPNDHKKFPKDIIQKADETFHFAKGTPSQEAEIYQHLHKAFNAKDVDQHLKKLKTNTFLVIKNDTIVFERYYRGYHKKSIQTGFSIAKSVVSLLVGKTIEQGKLESIDLPISNYIPELLDQDSRFRQSTIKQLLEMNSPICHHEMIDGLKAYYSPDLKELVFTKLKWCGYSKYGNYNHYNSILVGILLERITGMRIAKYFENHIWSKIGTEADASWSTDKKAQIMMAAGINARAIDFAKLGKLVLDDGQWLNKQLINKNWLQESIHNWNQLYWYDTDNSTDFHAMGLRGQILYVSPKMNTIILRLGSSKINFKKTDDDTITRMDNARYEFGGANLAEKIEEFAELLHNSY